MQLRCIVQILLTYVMYTEATVSWKLLKIVVEQNGKKNDEGDANGLLNTGVQPSGYSKTPRKMCRTQCCKAVSFSSNYYRPINVEIR